MHLSRPQLYNEEEKPALSFLLLDHETCHFAYMYENSAEDAKELDTFVGISSYEDASSSRLKILRFLLHSLGLIPRKSSDTPANVFILLVD